MKMFFAAIGGIVVAVLLGTCAYYGMTTLNVVTKPGQVLNRVITTDNIINSYDGFYRMDAAFKSRLSGIKGYQKSFETETDPGQLRLYRDNLNAMRQVCRDLATKYNANAEKLTSSQFRDWRLEDRLNIEECEK